MRFAARLQMTRDEYRAIAYHLGYHFAGKLLREGRESDSIRLAMASAQDHLRALKAYSADMDEMKRLGVEDALAGKPIDRRYATRPGPGGSGRTWGFYRPR